MISYYEAAWMTTPYIYYVNVRPLVFVRQYLRWFSFRGSDFLPAFAEMDGLSNDTTFAYVGAFPLIRKTGSVGHLWGSAYMDGLLNT